MHKGLVNDICRSFNLFHEGHGIERRLHMKIKVKVNKATVLKAAGIILGIIGSIVESEQNKVEINNAVQLYLEDKSKNFITLNDE